MAAATSFAINVTAINATLSYDVVSQFCDYLCSVAAADSNCAEFRAGYRRASGPAHQYNYSRPEALAFVRDRFALFHSEFDIWENSTNVRVQSQDMSGPVGDGSIGNGSSRCALSNRNVMTAVSMLPRGGVCALRPSQSCNLSIPGRH